MMERLGKPQNVEHVRKYYKKCPGTFILEHVGEIMADTIY